MDIENWTEKDMQAFGEAVQEAIKVRDYYIARFPDFHSVKDKIDSLPTIDDKINFLKEVISTWEVNCSIADFQGDITSEETKNRYLSLYNKILDHLKLQKELQGNSQQENSSNEYHFKEDFLNDLFEQCKDYFKCSESKFKVAMEEANFNEIIQRKGCVITRCFVFIAVIGKERDDWYTDAIKNINRIDKYKEVDKSYASGRINNFKEWANTIASIREQRYKK